MTSLVDPQAATGAEAGRPFGEIRRRLRMRHAARQLALGIRAQRRKRYRTALRCFTAAARAGNAEAQYRLGRAYAGGEGVVHHMPDAVFWYRRAAQQGHCEAQFQLSLAYLYGQAGAGSDWYRAAAARDPEAAEWNRQVWFPAGNSVPRDYAEAFHWSRRAAEQGVAEAEANLGSLYLRGLGCASDPAEARSWYERAAAQGSAEAEHGLGLIHENGLGVAIDLAAAARWYALAAGKDHDGAQVALGLMHLTGNGARRDPGRAATLFRQAAARGNARAHHNLGLLRLRGEGLPQDHAAAAARFRDAARQGYTPAMLSLAELSVATGGGAAGIAEAVLWYKAAAAAGDAEAQFLLGRLYADGEGVPRQMSQAAGWFERAAEQGHAVAQFNLAALTLHGAGVVRDPQKAIAWYTRAAEQGFADAQVRLAHLHLVGTGTDDDRATAARWLEKAAAQGDADAQFQLGVQYYLGDGVARDPATAGRWYRRAAEQGNRFAQHNLAEMLAHGEGVEQDRHAAAAWYRKGAAQGMAESEIALGDLCAAGPGVEPDLGAARQSYTKAAARGSAAAAARWRHPARADTATRRPAPTASPAPAVAAGKRRRWLPGRGRPLTMMENRAASPDLEGWPTISLATADILSLSAEELREAIVRRRADGAVYAVRTAAGGTATAPLVGGCRSDGSGHVEDYLRLAPSPFRWEPEDVILVNEPCYITVGSGAVFLGDGRLIRDTMWPSDEDQPAGGEETIAVRIGGGLRREDLPGLLQSAPILEDGVWAPLFSRWSSVYGHAVSESMVQESVLHRAGLSPLLCYAAAADGAGAQPMVAARARSPVRRLSHPLVKVPRAIFASKFYRHYPLGGGLRDTAADIKARVQRQAAAATPGPERIYVSRRGMQARPMTNEAELIQRLLLLGFHIAEPQSMSFEDQVSTFRDARLIVGPYGSGLVNSIFAAPHATLCELRPLYSTWESPLRDAYYYGLAAMMSFSYGAHITANRPDIDLWHCDVGTAVEWIEAISVAVAAEDREERRFTGVAEAEAA